MHEIVETVEQTYNELAGFRSVIENRWEEYAAWTLPTVFPLQGTDATEEMQNDIQSFGAQATNHLSNKLMMGLFSSSRPFFRLEVNNEFKEELRKGGIELTAIQKALQTAEKEAIKELARLAVRDKFTQLLQLLIITGNALLYLPTKGSVQVYNPREYVVKRDLDGRAIRIITKDEKSFYAMPEHVQTALLARTPTIDRKRKVCLYTDVRWDYTRKKYIVEQWTEHDIKVSSKEGVFPEDKVPFHALTWKLIRGEDWGRGLVEDYAGDFHAHSVGNLALTEIIAIISQIKGLVDPAGVTDVDELNNTPNGQWCSGRETDVSMLAYDKVQDMQQIMANIDRIERRLSRAFLMDTNVVRDAERVTAEEVRLIARDLETSLGGVYTRLAQSLQMPVARLLLQRIEVEVGNNAIEPVIITGLDALSRSGDLDSYRLFIQDAALLAALSPEIQRELSLERILKYIATNNSFDQEVAFLTAEEKAARDEQERAAQQQAIQQQVTLDAAPDVIKQQATNGGS